MAILHTGSVESKPLVARALEEFDVSGMKFAADQVLPYGRTELQRGVLPVIQREDMLRIERTRRAPGAGFSRVTYRTEGLEFACEDDGLEGLLPDEQRAMYRASFDAELMAAKQVVTMLRLGREQRVSAAVFNTSVWTGAALYTDLSGTAPWTTTSTNVFAGIEAALEKVRLGTGMYANALICNTTNIGRLIQNEKVMARFPGAARITRQMLLDSLGALFGIDRLIECGAVYSSAKEGQAFAGANVWSNLYAMVARVCVSEDLAEPGIGRTMLWTGVDGGNASFGVKTYRAQSNKSDVIQVDQYTDELILGAAYGHLLKIAAA